MMKIVKDETTYKEENENYKKEWEDNYAFTFSVKKRTQPEQRQ